MRYPLKKILQRPALLILIIVVTSLAFRIPEKPTIYIIGDSTVRNANKLTWGWGSLLEEFFNTDKINIQNSAMAGRSTRTFIKEGRWEKVLNQLTPGDYVLMQFGHNEGSKPDTTRQGYRGVLKGVDEDTVKLTWGDGTVEIVHTYGWYIRKFVRDTKAKKAIPMVLSMIPRNDWVDGKVVRADHDYGLWAKTIAEQEGVTFVDLNSITADKYDRWGPDKVKGFFPEDHTHTNKEGARINAESVAEGIRSSRENKLKKYLLKRK